MGKKIINKQQVISPSLYLYIFQILQNFSIFHNTIPHIYIYIYICIYIYTLYIYTVYIEEKWENKKL